MKVLFSPVGSTDPITNCRDGALLHICRTYRPDKVYIYLTAEMCKYSDMDDRYRQSVKLLQKELGCECDIELIRCEEMKEVQIFDAFIQPYEKIIDQIIQTDHPDLLYLNVSSGTPAMKSALQMLSLFWNDIVAIQVSTPVKSSNTVHEDKENYDLNLQWELNEDNIEDYQNRCIESNARKLLDRLRKESICEFIRDYDYEAAKLLAEEMTERPSDIFMKCLEVAIERQKLTLSVREVPFLKKDLPIADWYPIANMEEAAVLEYIMVMQIKLKRKQYVDFIRDVTPILFTLSIRFLQNECGLSLDDIGRVKHDTYYLSLTKLTKQNLLVDPNWNDKSFIGSKELIKIMETRGVRQEILDNLLKMREVEKHVRNKAAHEIVGINDVTILKSMGMNSETIMKIILKLAAASGIRVSKENCNSFNVMNEDLCEMLRRS